MPNKPEDFLDFTPLDRHDMNHHLNEFYKYYKKVLGLSGIRSEDITFAKSVLMEIITRIAKRRVYFKVFYNSKMSELNEIALFCFWVSKLKPFKHIDQNKPINEHLALYFFFHRIDQTARAKGQNVRITARIIQVLSYDLRYRDISKEALMTLAESLIG
ncbi:MAG: hypothetical protein LBK63_09230 [Treponema sp.]|jgi:hypothetical protein|nr:hypothetical protein [Treponema sp.]